MTNKFLGIGDRIRHFNRPYVDQDALRLNDLVLLVVNARGQEVGSLKIDNYGMRRTKQGGGRVKHSRVLTDGKEDPPAKKLTTKKATSMRRTTTKPYSLKKGDGSKIKINPALLRPLMTNALHKKTIHGGAAAEIRRLREIATERIQQKQGMHHKSCLPPTPPDSQPY